MTTNSAWRDTIRPTRRDIDHEKERLRALIVRTGRSPMNNQGSQSPGRVVAWCALLLGAAMSVAANALHVLLVTGPATGDTSAAQVIGALFGQWR